MCKCFDEIKDKLNARTVKELPAHTEFSSDWENKSLFFGADPPKINVGISYSYEYRIIKKNGDHAKNKTKNKSTMVMQYCPFCGIDTTRVK